MGVIVEVRIPTHRFEFGRRVPTPRDGPTEIERMGAVGDGDVSVFAVSGSFGEGGSDGAPSPSVDVDGCRFEAVTEFDGEIIYVMTWHTEADRLFGLLDDHGGIVRRGTGTPDAWGFEMRFPSHDAFAAFRADCEDETLGTEIERAYNPTRRGVGAWYGLTPRQRRTLELAVERGYYDIPRRCTTIELADELGISDQAVTERLRRGIVAFVTNALLLDRDG
jgi:predicted DNA binding protein